MNNTKLLVIMPLYNAEATVARAVESILYQTYVDLSLIIVDDASSDNSLEIVKQYLSDPRVTVYTNKQNMGAYYSRNIGLYLARKQKWTHFTTHDADDISFNYRYQALLRALEKTKNANAIQDTFERVDLFSGKVLSKSLTMAHAIFTREVFEKIGYFDNVRFGGDWEYWARLAEYNRSSKKTTTTYLETMGESYIGNHNLTVIIPENSSHRLEYVKATKIKLRRSSVAQLYTEFKKQCTTQKVHND